MGQREPAVDRGGRIRRARALSTRPVAISTTTSDGVVLAGLHLPAAAGAPAVVIGHGFTNSVAKPSTRAVIDWCGESGGVIAFDFRGHGGSGGRGTVGRDEVLDLDAAVAFARAAGYGPVGVIGFSMGASIAIRHGALGCDRADAVVAISSPSRWYIRDTLPMRRVHWLLESPLGPPVGRVLGVRLDAAWTDIPATPLEVIDRIAPTPLLLVHGTQDRYFTAAHALALHAASRQHAELWIEPGMGHAESGCDRDLIARVAQWLRRSNPAGCQDRCGQSGPCANS